MGKLGLQPDAATASVATLALGSALAGRTLEDGVATALQAPHKLVSRLLELKRQRLEGQLDLAVKQWEAVTKELLMNIDPHHREPLTLRVQHLEIEIGRLEAELNTLG